MPERTIHTFQIPEIIGGEIKSVGLVELTAAEELMAAKRVKTDPAAYTFQMAKAALAQVNGDPVSVVDGSADRAWERMGPKVRALVVTAWNDISQPTEEAVSGFLQSRKVQVGA